MAKILNPAEKKKCYPLTETHLWQVAVEGAGRDLWMTTLEKDGLDIEKATAKAEKWLRDNWTFSWIIKGIKHAGTIDG